ncbi:MAG: two-component system response regulator [Roseiarcus sp.]
MRAERICIVDADPYHVKVMALVLEYRNAYKTFAFDNAERAWTYSLMFRPAAIVCDWRLKPVDGLALLRRVRGHQLTREIPFLLVSLEPNEEEYRRALAEGADALLPKPFSLHMFHDAVAQATERRAGGRMAC